MDIKVIHINGSKMPADALTRKPRQPLVPSQSQKKHNNLVSSSTSREAYPQNMSSIQWKFEQNQDPLYKVVTNQRLRCAVFKVDNIG